jgi:general secretion pathway protein D
MSVLGLRPRLLSLICVIVAALSVPAPALAASTVTVIVLSPQPTGGALLQVSFSGGVPLYHVIGAGTSDVTVNLDGTTLGPQVSPVIQGTADVTSVTATSTGTNSSLTLHLSGATPVRIRPTQNALLLEVSPPPAQGNPFGSLLSTPSVTGLGPVTEVVFLKYADISEVAGLLSQNSNIASNDTFSPQQSNVGTSQLNGSFGGGGAYAQPVQQQIFQGGGAFGQSTGLATRVNENIAVDRRLNAIILSGTADVVADLKELIAKIDVPLQSVLLETQIVELDETASKNVGLDASPDGTGALVNASGGTGGTTGGGVLARTLSTQTSQASLQAILYAQEVEGHSKVIAKPRILAQSGQQASILTGDAIPIITNIVSGTTNTVSQQVNYVNVGVNLQIEPRVSSDGFVTSHIYSEVSSVTSYTSGIPEISQRTASTVATVKDGEAFIIGGLLQENEIKTLTKIPFIGDIPIIGAFFKYLSSSSTQSNLYLVVTPHIVRGPANTTSNPSPFPTSFPLELDGPKPSNATYHLSTVPTPLPSPTTHP